MGLTSNEVIEILIKLSEIISRKIRNFKTFCRISFIIIEILKKINIKNQNKGKNY